MSALLDSVKPGQVYVPTVLKPLGVVVLPQKIKPESQGKHNMYTLGQFTVRKILQK
jgi:hypothetical protein